MTNRPEQTNGADLRAVEATVLRVFEREGYKASRSPNAAGSTTVLDAQDHRALVRFLWGAPQDSWGDQHVRQLRMQMEDLQADRGHLISNGLFSDVAKQAAQTLGVSITEGPALKQTLFDYAPPLQRPRQEPENPLPFERYIPWFVGISLVVIAITVVLLISIALALEPVGPTA